MSRIELLEQSAGRVQRELERFRAEDMELQADLAESSLNAILERLRVLYAERDSCTD